MHEPRMLAPKHQISLQTHRLPVTIGWLLQSVILATTKNQKIQNMSVRDSQYFNVSKCSLYTFYNNPAPLNGSMQFHYCTDSNPGTGADDAFVLKCGVWRNATWPSHSRLAIAASARHFQICFSPLTFWLLVCSLTLCLPSPFYALSYV